MAWGSNQLFLPGNEQYPDPFADIASLAMPNQWRNVLEMAQFLWIQQGMFAEAMHRVISYFLTELEIETDDEDEREKWEEFCRNTLRLIPTMQALYIDRMAYGNSFASLIVPIKRLVACPKCGSAWPLDIVHENHAFSYSWRNFRVHGVCPRCKVGSGYSGEFKFIDQLGNVEKDSWIRRWPPLEIEVIYDHYSDRCRYLWRIPEDYKRDIREGRLFHLERCPAPVLDAIRDNQLFAFHPGYVFHMKEPTLAGLRTRGWGLPRIITRFRQVFYVQVLRRYNEAIAMDYVIPFRVITPAPRPGSNTQYNPQGADALMNVDAQKMSRELRRLVARRRRYPTEWHTLGFPINYQALGGDASQLAPKDLLEQGEQTLLSTSGIPVDLWQGTLQLQVAPVSLRLFEANWHHLVFDGNAFISWLLDMVSHLLRWDKVKGYLQSVTLADNMEKNVTALQLYLAQQLSGEAAFRSLGIDWRRDKRQQAEEQIFQQELQEEMQKRIEASGMSAAMSQGMGGPGAAGAAPGGAPAGGAPAGGAPPAGGDPAAMGMAPGPVTQYIQSTTPGQGTDPEEQVAIAESIANELQGKPESLKNSELRLLKQHSESLHALVLQKLKAIRQDARNQGGAMVLQQAYG